MLCSVAPRCCVALCCVGSWKTTIFDAAAAPAPATYDPFSVSGDPNQLIGGPPPEIRPVGDIGEWFRKLATSSSGVLYEDTYLQVLHLSVATLLAD